MDNNLEERKDLQQSESLKYIMEVCNAYSHNYQNELELRALQELSVDQTTLWGYIILRREIMEGGFVQLIHNGYGKFFFENPFAAMLKQWGLRDLSKLVYEARKLYWKFGNEIVKDCTDEEFMAMFEKYEKFDKYDDDFVENEQAFTDEVANYVKNNEDSFK